MKYCLTFDGAPDPPGTDRILEVLAKHDVKATFFMEGSRLEKEAACARRVRDAGHDIGNHSYTHQIFTNLSMDEVRKELEMTRKIIFDETGVLTKYVRPPWGKSNDEIVSLFNEMDYRSVLWSYSVKDWEGPNAEAVAQRAMAGAHDGGIPVFHDSIGLVPETLELVIPRLKKAGYTLMTLSSLYQDEEELI